MKQFKIFTLTTILLLGLSTGCKKSFLDVLDNSVILREQYVKDLNSLEEFLNGVYIRFTQTFFEGRNQVYPDLIADNIKSKTGGSQLLIQYKWAQTSENTISLYNYGLLRACNFVVEKANEFRQMDAVKADHLKAQVLTLRAFVYFVMVNAYGQAYNFTPDASHPGIALIQSSDPFETVSKRNTVGEVYTAIITDLNTAISIFPTSVAFSTLRINKVAAKGLLSRVFLFKGDYAVSKNSAREVIAQVPLMAAPNYPSKLFTLQETEALFQLAPSSSSNPPGAFATTFQGRYFNGSSSNVQFFATAGITSLLTSDPNDVRRAWIKPGGAGRDSIKKYPVNVVAGFNPTSHSYYPTLLRSSEMYLNAAESYAQLGMEDSARYFLDAIRTRANSTVLPTTAMGPALLDSIYVERRKELAFEGLRMFDLLRWKKGVNRTADVTNGAPAVLPYPSDKAIAPIPLSDVKITGFQQNPGY